MKRQCSESDTENWYTPTPNADESKYLKERKWKLPKKDDLKEGKLQKKIPKKDDLKEEKLHKKENQKEEKLHKKEELKEEKLRKKGDLKEEKIPTKGDLKEEKLLKSDDLKEEKIHAKKEEEEEEVWSDTPDVSERSDSETSHCYLVGVPRFSDRVFDSDSSDIDSDTTEFEKEPKSKCEKNDVPLPKGIRLDLMKYRMVGPPAMRSRQLGPVAYATSKSTFPKKSICAPKPSSPNHVLPRGEDQVGAHKDKGCKVAWQSICVSKPSSAARAYPNGEKPRDKYPMTGEEYRAKVRAQKDRDCKDAWRLWGIILNPTAESPEAPESKFTEGAVRMARLGRRYLLIAAEENHTIAYQRLRKEMMQKRQEMGVNTYMHHMQEYVDAKLNYHHVRSRLRRD